MMTPTTIALFGVVSLLLLAAMVYISRREIRTTPPGMTPFRGLLPVSEHPPDLERPAPVQPRVLLATDGSPCSDRAVQSVAARPWPTGSQFEVVSVAHGDVPGVADPELMLGAAHADARDAARAEAPVHAERAGHLLASMGMPVATKVLEGRPQDAIIEEARNWHADLVVVGSHGRGAVARRLLGSVSQHVALHAPCSVEIVRCPETTAAAGLPAAEAPGARAATR